MNKYNLIIIFLLFALFARGQEPVDHLRKKISINLNQIELDEALQIIG